MKSDAQNPASVSHSHLANAIRFLSADAVQKANSGHPGMPMGFADVATVLYRDFLKFDARDPSWPDRDRFVLSAGHGSMLLYSLLYLSGYEDMSLEDIKNFRQLHSKTAGHPEFGEAQGIETTTGPLGQGISNAVGMALAERLLNARFGNDLVNHHTYAVVGDGCLMEGISHEALSLAGHLKLNKLIVLFDDNDICIDGPTNMSVSENTIERMKAYGFNTWAVDGHNPTAIARALAEAKKSDKPAFIACKTVIGYGAPNTKGTAEAHGKALGDEEIALTRKELGWSHAPFDIPQDILNEWRGIGARGGSENSAWKKRLDQSPHKKEFERLVKGDLPVGWEKTLQEFIQKQLQEKPKIATRQASGNTLDVLTKAIPELIGGSADLTGSNNTKAKGAQDISSKDFSGSYIRYGVREHAMAGIMNGMALHGGIIPFGGTFLVFTDYCRPSIRLSALMKQRVIYVMTHDSIGLGEDGPTHQPVEHLASLRAMPNVNVFRPCDAVETAECWALALQSKTTPSILALTRQGLPTLREKAEQNYCAKGAYILRDADNAQVTLIASGSEVEIAVKAQEQLKSSGILARVVSMPCRELFDAQAESYRNSVINPDTFRVVIEAASPFGWDSYADQVVGMTSFGASAPAKDLYQHFGITVEKVVEIVKNRKSN